jgi:hypothetical protein
MRPTTSRRGALFAALALLPSAAHADGDPSKCSAVDVDASWVSSQVDLSGDTGYLPQGFAAQLRLSGRLASESSVASGVRANACWDGGKMSVAVDGRAGSGWMDVAYGAQVQVFAKIDTTILGQRIFWEGQIPLPVIPDDLLIASGGYFDPKVNGAWYVSDATDPVTLLSTDLIGDLIGIIGISGGLRIAATASMQTTYTMGNVQLGDASGAGPFELAAPSGGYGAALELPLSIAGNMHYAPALRFGLRFDVKILGVRVVDWELAGVGMNLPGLDRQLTLTSEAPAHIGLPVLDGIGEGARIDFASSATQALLVRNKGERDLLISIANAPAGVTVDGELTIAAGKDAQLRITAADVNQVAGGATLALATNDPDHPTLDVALGADIGGTDPGMVEEPAEAGGCSSGGGAGGWAGLVLVLVALGLRRTLAPCLRRR